MLTHLGIDNLPTASARHLSGRGRTGCDADSYSGAGWSHRIWPFRIARVFVGVVDFAGHFQTGQKLDITRETADRRHGETGALVDTGKLRPICLELFKRRSFVLRDAVEFDGRPALKPALSHDIEFRHGVRDGNG